MHEMIFFVHREDRAIQAARRCLQQAGYSIRSLSQPAFLTSVDRDRQCLILIDSVQRVDYGVDVCKRIRRSPFLGHLPIVLLTDPGEDSRALGLEAGADDCVAQPYDPGELVARIQSLLDRFQSGPETNLDSVSTDLVIDRAAMKLSVRGEEVPTTTLEFRLLSYLALHRGRVFTRDLLLDAVWGDTEFVTPRTVDTCVRRVRHKIEPDRSRPTYLKTVRGVGYRFDGIARWAEHDA